MGTDGVVVVPLYYGGTAFRKSLKFNIVICAFFVFTAVHVLFIYNNLGRATGVPLFHTPVPPPVIGREDIMCSGRLSVRLSVR